MRTRIGMSVAAVLVFVSQPAASQSVDRFEVTPYLGVFLPRNPVGPAAPAGGPWLLRLERADAAFAPGLNVQANWSPHIGTRIGVQAVLPADVSGFFECRPGTACPSVLLPSDAERSVLLAMADIVVTPVRVHSTVRSYIIIGAGFRRDHYSWPDAAVLVDRGEHTETAYVLRASLGVDVALRGSALRLELEDYQSPKGAELFDDSTADEFGSPRRRAQHDLALTLGWRLLRF